MPVHETNCNSTTFSPAQIASAREDGERAAERVISYIRSAVANGAPEPKPLTPEWLRASAESNLSAWKRNGLGLERELGEVANNSPEFIDRVLELFINRTAWSARHLLEADLILDAQNDDAGIDIMARFLWANRHNHRIEE